MGSQAKFILTAIHVCLIFFSRLLGSKLDLTQVEGLADLLAAETEEQRLNISQHLIFFADVCTPRALAVGQLGGELGKLYSHWRTVRVALKNFVGSCFTFLSAGSDCLFGSRGSSHRFC